LAAAGTLSALALLFVAPEASRSLFGIEMRIVSLVASAIVAALAVLSFLYLPALRWAWWAAWGKASLLAMQSGVVGLLFADIGASIKVAISMIAWLLVAWFSRGAVSTIPSYGRGIGA